MNIIKQSFEILEQEDWRTWGAEKQVEKVGRTCYKSEDKITTNSYKDFVARMVASKHFAMLEHGTLYMEISATFDNYDEVKKYQTNPYSRVNVVDNKAYITTNLRVIYENDWLNDFRYLCEPTEYHELRICVKFTCNRQISHEFVRHRVFSFAQESQRYCNYSKDKFSNEVKFIEPTALLNISDKESQNYAIWYESCANAEVDYLAMIKNGATPQEARDILPNACATELIMTGFESDWEHFFKLRCAKDAHPQAQEIANMIKEQF